VPVTHAGKRGQIVLDQCQTMDKSSLTTRLGALSNTTLGKALTVLQELFAD
jgi:mRNA interferase MazF